MNNLEWKINELSNVKRLVENTLNLLVDIDIKGRDVFAVAEIISFLQNFRGNVDSQLTILNSSLPTQGSVDTSKVVEPEVVSQEQVG